VLSPSAFSAALSTDAVFATAFQKRDGSYGAAILSEQGKLLHSVDLPERGHDITFDPASKRSVVFARQPGTFAVVFDHAGKSEPLTITSVEGRHFYGSRRLLAGRRAALRDRERFRQRRRHGRHL
jgi:hypothetical protein